jgi:hypothetical protein
MKKMMTYCFLGLFLGGAALLACSNNKNNNEAESEPEKGRIEKMTDKAAKKMVKRIRTPINKARSVKDQQEDRLNDMDESLKE